MDTIKIPTKVEAALKDQKWTEAMQIEMEALQKINTWNAVTLPKGKWDANRCLPLDTRLTEQLIGTRQG